MARYSKGRRGRGRGGAKKGHEFFGNQYIKVAKYSRRGIRAAGSAGRRVGRFAKKHKLATAMVGGAVANIAIAGVLGKYRAAGVGAVKVGRWAAASTAKYAGSGASRKVAKRLLLTAGRRRY
jgi:hypothetical protein